MARAWWSRGATKPCLDRRPSRRAREVVDVTEILNLLGANAAVVRGCATARRPDARRIRRGHGRRRVDDFCFGDRMRAFGIRPEGHVDASQPPSRSRCNAPNSAVRHARGAQCASTPSTSYDEPDRDRELAHAARLPHQLRRPSKQARGLLPASFFSRACPGYVLTIVRETRLARRPSASPRHRLLLGTSRRLEHRRATARRAWPSS